MKNRLKKCLRPTLFIAAGALAGLGCYVLAGCTTGTCVITANPWTEMAYMGIIGWLVSGIIGTGCNDKCNM